MLAGVYTHCYRFLLEQSHVTQFIVLENDAAPFKLGATASVTEFVGLDGVGDRGALS